MSLALQLPSSLTVGPLVPYKSSMSHFVYRCRTCVDWDSTIWYFVYLFHITHCLCQQVRWWKHPHLRPLIFCKKIYCISTKNKWKGYHNKIVWSRFVLMQDSWQRLRSDSTSWQMTLKNSHNLQNQWLVVCTLCQQMKNHLTRKVGFEGTPKLGPYWKLQPVICKVNLEWKLELNL